VRLNNNNKNKINFFSAQFHSKDPLHEQHIKKQHMTFNPSKRQALGRSFVARDSVSASQSTFFGTKAPVEVTQLVLLMPNTDQATFIKLLKFVLEYIKGTEVRKYFKKKKTKPGSI